MFIISGYIEPWNMEKLPILYDGYFFVTMETYVFVIDAIFCKIHSIGPSNMCIHFEKNRWKIDHFRKSEKIECFLLRHVAQEAEYTWPWPLTFDLDIFSWPLTLRPWSIIDALKKTLQKCIVLTSCDAKTAPRMAELRPTYRFVFCQ